MPKTFSGLIHSFGCLNSIVFIILFPWLACFIAAVFLCKSIFPDIHRTYREYEDMKAERDSLSKEIQDAEAELKAIQNEIARDK